MFALPFLIATLTQLPASRGVFPDHAVIGIAGGEDMVVLQELGYFEAFRTAEVPDAGWTFLGLAREGDTVFDPPRGPAAAADTRRGEVAVMLAQFGQTEALTGSDTNAFAVAYEALVRGWQDQGAQVWVIPPFGPAGHPRLAAFRAAAERVAGRAGAAFVPVRDFAPEELRGDGLHLNDRGHRAFAHAYFRSFPTAFAKPASPQVIGLVREKNRVWQRFFFPPNAGVPGAEGGIAADRAAWLARIEDLETRIRRHYNPSVGGDE